MYELRPGLWVEPTPYEAELSIEGIDVHAWLDWDHSTKKPIIERIEITKGSAVTIDTNALRSITLPGLLAVASTSARFWISEEGVEPVTEERQEGETLEEWAARLVAMAVITNRSPAETIAEAQGITIGSAHQRLTTIRKMGLIDSKKESV